MGDPKLRCKKCKGKKVNSEKKILEVQIDKGMEDGQKIPFMGEGDQEPEMEPGDIIIILDEKEHPVFKRNGVDLILQQTINITEALCGFKKLVKTLDDRQLLIQTVPGEIIKTGDVKCVYGEGMPTYRNPFEKGRLLIAFSVQFPESIDPKMVEKIQALLPPKNEPKEITEDCEEVDLNDIDQASERRSGKKKGGQHHANVHHHGHGNASDDDEDDGSGGIPCATQ